MTNDIAKYGLILCMYILGVWAVAVPAPSNELGLEEFKLKGIPVIKYNGPRYKMTEEDKARLRHAYATGGKWERPVDMPIIDIKEGTTLDLGVNSTLTKRSGYREVGAYGARGCSPDSFISNAVNFGCGSGCINVPSGASSGRVQEQHHSHPYPTMDVFSGQDCTGSVQHLGVTNLDSCTNYNAETGHFYSYIGYYNC